MDIPDREVTGPKLFDLMLVGLSHLSISIRGVFIHRLRDYLGMFPTWLEHFPYICSLKLASLFSRELKRCFVFFSAAKFCFPEIVSAGGAGGEGT